MVPGQNHVMLSGTTGSWGNVSLPAVSVDLAAVDVDIDPVDIDQFVPANLRRSRSAALGANHINFDIIDVLQFVVTIAFPMMTRIVIVTWLNILLVTHPLHLQLTSCFPCST
jgi:hypothetical protein